MAKHKTKTKNCAGGLWWVTRPACKMNNKELKTLGESVKRFAKRYTSKKRRFFLKSEKCE